MANKFLPHNVQVNETKFYNRHAISMLPTMPVPVETIQSAEITSPTSAQQNSSNNSNVVVGSNPCAVPIATLSIRYFSVKITNFRKISSNVLTSFLMRARPFLLLNMTKWKTHKKVVKTLLVIFSFFPLSHKFTLIHLYHQGFKTQRFLIYSKSCLQTRFTQC